MANSGVFPAIRTAVRESPAYETALRLTLVLLLLYGAPGQVIAVRVLAATMLAIPALITLGAGWMAITALVAYANLRDLYVLDNHQHLIMYWLIAIVLSRFVREADRLSCLRITGRTLVALVFFFAAAWKIIGGQYFSGLFLHHTFLTDSRFRYLAAWLVGGSPGDIVDGDAAVAMLATLAPAESVLPLVTSAALRWFTFALSWLAILVEVGVAVLFAFPSDRLYRVRHWALMLFVGFAYFLFPVIGFAVILAILGYSACDETDANGRAAYIALLAGIHATLLPWQQMLFSWL